MSVDPSAEEVRAAEGYEALLVPGLMECWVDPVLDSAGIESGHRVLDVACGTGILARNALARVGPTGRVTGVDLLPGMLTVAERLTPDVDWRQGKAEDLPLEDESQDVMVSQFGMMFFEDPDRALSEMRRVLSPGGRAVVAVWDGLEANPAYAAEVDLLERLAGPAAADAVRIPFRLGDRSALVASFESAGLTPVHAETRSGIGGFPSVRSMVEADLYGWLPLFGIELDDALNQRILAEAEELLGDFVGADGRMRFETSAHILSASRVA